MSILPDQPPDQQTQPGYDPADPWLSIWLLVTDISERVDQLAAMLDQPRPDDTYAAGRRALTRAFVATVAFLVLLVALAVALIVARVGAR